MILKQTIFAGLAMLLFYLPLKSEITTTIFDQSIAVHTDKEAVEGYKGCDPFRLKKVPAYIFELQVKAPIKTRTCDWGSGKTWSTLSRKTSKDGSTIFENLPDGMYKVVCLSGEAIGCLIKSEKTRSIVFAKEVSQVINLGKMPFQVLGRRPTTSKNLFGILNVFPNPTSDKLNIHLTGSQIDSKVTIVLYNLLGQEAIRLEDETVNVGSLNSWQLNISQLISGSYMLRVFDDKGISFQQKIVVE